MKRLLTILLLVSSCATVKYGNIERDLIIVSQNKKDVQDVKIKNVSLAVLTRAPISILAISKTYQVPFREDDLIKKAKELGASQIFISDKTECAPRNVWGEFQGCWTYDLIYFAE